MHPNEGYHEHTSSHLDMMQLETVQRARGFRVRYPDGQTEMVSVQCSTPRSRWTVTFEALAIRVIQACGSVDVASKLLRIDWLATQRIIEHEVLNHPLLPQRARPLCYKPLKRCAWLSVP